jgi:hypothetical protein
MVSWAVPCWSRCSSRRRDRCRDGRSRRPCLIPRRTHMRTPLVKRHTTPLRGIFAFFPLSRTWRRLLSVACAALIAVCRCHPGVAAPNTYGGSVATAVASAENRWGILCGLEILLGPQTGLCTGGAAPVRLASSCQTRERGSPHHLGAERRLERSQSGSPSHGPRLWDKQPMRPWAFTDAVPHDVEHAC